MEACSTYSGSSETPLRARHRPGENPATRLLPSFPGRLRAFAAVLAIAVALTIVSCKREARTLKVEPERRDVVLAAAPESDIHPGGSVPLAKPANPYEGNAYAISEGKRLFNWYNCSGCHSHGGGGMGPPLLEHQWIYGSDPANIFDTIVNGRPNGMPSWGGRIPEYQLWQLVTYVRSLGGFEPQTATPARGEELESKAVEQPK